MPNNGKVKREQWLATEHNRGLSVVMVLPALWFVISDYLTLGELVCLSLTCRHFYYPGILDTSFLRHLAFFPATMRQKERELAQPFKSYPQIVQQRAVALMAYGQMERERTVIKQWLLIDVEHFRKNPDLFINQKITGLEVPSQLNAYQFFSFIGALMHLKTLHACIQDDRLRRSLLTADKCHAFMLAASRGHTGVVKALWRFMEDYTDRGDLRRQCLTVWDSYAFRGAANNGYIETMRTLWDLLWADQDLRRQMLTAGNCHAFWSAAVEGHREMVMTLWEFAGDFPDYEDLRRQFLMAMDCIAFQNAAYKGDIGMLRILLGFTGDDKDVKRSFLLVDNCHAFWYSVVSRHIDVLKALCELSGDDNDLRRQLLMVHDYGVFRIAATSGCQEIVKTLCEFVASGDRDLKRQLLEYFRNRPHLMELYEGAIKDCADCEQSAVSGQGFFQRTVGTRSPGDLEVAARPSESNLINRGPNG